MTFESILTAVVVVAAFAWGQSVFRMQRQQGRQLQVALEEISTLKQLQLRRSVAFLELRNDLGSLMECIHVLSMNDAETRMKVECELQKSRHERLKAQIEHGPVIGDVLKGLEFPNEHNDPFFSAPDASSKMVPNALST